MIPATALVLALLSSSAAAGSADAPSPTAAAQAAPAPVVQTVQTEKVCRMERTIGSNRSKRVCRTREELEREKAHAQNQLANPARGG